MFKRVALQGLMSVLLAAGIAAGCGAAKNEKAEVAKAIENSIKWCFPEKSRERLYGSVVNDSTLFIFHPDSGSTIRGFDAFKDFSERVFLADECRPEGSTIKDLRIIMSRSGDVAWFSCLLDDWGKSGDRPWNWVDVRWSGVLQKNDGRWVIMQEHFSKAEDAVRAEVMKKMEAKR